MTATGQEILGEERQFYEAERQSLVATAEGKFALIKGHQLVGTFDTPDRAYAEGIDKFGNVPMLIIQVRREEPRNQVPALALGLVRASIP